MSFADYKRRIDLVEHYTTGNNLYDSEQLKNLDWPSVSHCLTSPITNEDPGEPWLLFRPLNISDYEKGYLEILSQLTAVGNITKQQFERQFRNMQGSSGYYVTVIEDTRNNTLIGSSTLITEYKFIHECGLRARLEDVVVNDSYRGKQLGKL
ncbi:hypothetical protein JTB14_034981 [Gonioctena quinquepunctata]|nr:hypothetical protein JTB14_034981 [Gonioctena quinquepunctata]